MPDGAPAAVRDLVLDRVRDVLDHPRPGIVFKDIGPLLADGPSLRAVVEHLADPYAGEVDAVVGVEARGFLLAAPLAYRLGLGVVPVRKAGKLPGAVLRSSYELEYGAATIEVQADAFVPGARVVVVDDVLATGGTAAASCDLVEEAGARVVGFAVLLELAFLDGRRRLDGRVVHSIAAV